MKKWMFAAFATVLILSGCGQSDSKDDAAKEEEVPEILEAVLDVPEKADAGEEVTLVVTVTQGEEFVEDANEVKFEIWKDGQKDSSEMLEAKHTEEGKYTVNKTFSEDGAYNVQSHVTARSMHTMPKKLIQVGNVEEGHGHEEGGHEHGEAGSEHSDSHAHGDVSIELIKPDHIHANEQTALSVQLNKEDTPLSKADVKLEISGHGSDPAWVNLNEDAKGEYKGDYQFPASGNYTVKIHVKNDEGLHEHTEVEIIVE